MLVLMAPRVVDKLGVHEADAQWTDRNGVLYRHAYQGLWQHSVNGGRWTYTSDHNGQAAPYTEAGP